MAEKLLLIKCKRGDSTLYKDMELVSVREADDQEQSPLNREIFFSFYRPYSEKDLWEQRLKDAQSVTEFDGIPLPEDQITPGIRFVIKAPKRYKSTLYSVKTGKRSATTKKIRPRLLEVQENTNHENNESVIDVRAFPGGETTLGSGGAYADLVELAADCVTGTIPAIIRIISNITQTNDRARFSHDFGNQDWVIDGQYFRYTTTNVTQSVYFSGAYNVGTITIERFHLIPTMDITGYAYFGFNAEGDYIFRNSIVEVNQILTIGHLFYLNTPIRSFTWYNNFVYWVTSDANGAGAVLAIPYNPIGDAVYGQNNLVITNSLSNYHTGQSYTGHTANSAFLGFTATCFNNTYGTSENIMTTDNNGSVGLTNVMPYEQYVTFDLDNENWAMPVNRSLADLNGSKPTLSVTNFDALPWQAPFSIGLKQRDRYMGYLHYVNRGINNGINVGIC